VTGDLHLDRLRRRVRRATVARLARTAMRVRRPERLAVVYGAPDYEENSLVTALRLTELYPGRTILVCRDPVRTGRYLDIAAAVIGGDPAGVMLHPLRKWRLLDTIGRAELLFYTHGLFASPPALGSRLHINLWHGTGPKSSANRNFPSRFQADALSSASPVWGAATARSLGTVEPVTVLPGNARADLLVQTSRARERLGWEADEAVVLWLPTYRRSTDVSVGTLREGVPLLKQGIKLLRESAARNGVRLIVKPHSFDAERLEALGAELLRTDDLWARGVTLGETLAASDAVISDYSSAWVDAMAAGVPVGLYCPDLDAYDHDRGFNPPPMWECAAGLFLQTPADLDEFFGSVSSRGFRPRYQKASADVLGLVPGPRSAAMLQQVGMLGLRRRGDDFGLLSG
jgi:CDP-Glycerol:Poly(glycerophosphate) glycerophosphotransferase